MAKNILSLFLEKLLAFPLWVKEIIYLRLYQNLSQYLSEDFITIEEKDIFHLYTPILSFAGRTELAERKDGLDSNIYNFLENVAASHNMLEISLNNFWTMEEVAKYFVLCLDQNYVKTPESNNIHAMAGYISGKFRTGEYFKRVGKINVDQLEQTIIAQKESVEKGIPLKIAEIMINLGYITEKDTSSLLTIKEEAKKRFILDPTIVPKEETGAIKDLKYYLDEIERLNQQNRLLRDQLNKILAFVKKNG